MTLPEMAAEILGLKSKQTAIDAALAARNTEHAKEIEAITSRAVKAEAAQSDSTKRADDLAKENERLKAELSAANDRAAKAEADLATANAKLGTFDAEVEKAAGEKSAQIVAKVAAKPIADVPKEGDNANAGLPGIQRYQAAIKAQIAKR